MTRNVLKSNTEPMRAGASGGFFVSWPSAADILDRNGGEGPGFNALRLTLSLTILAVHSGWVAGADTGEDWTGWHGLFLLSLVPAFFALSGFLVTGSASRTGAVRPFITLRAIRIVPALFVEIALSALVLGPLLTTWALRDYVSDIRFWEYFGNVVGRIRFELPGVFESNPVANTVNQNLWTLKPEFYCYIVMALMIAAGLLRRRVLFAALTIGIIIAATAWAYLRGFGVTEGNYHWTVVVFYFLVGCLYFQWRDRLKIHWSLFAAALAASIALMSAPRELSFLVPPFLTYCVVYIGLLPLKLPQRIRKLDVSYGIYLYGFPIQQALVSQLDVVHGSGLVLFAVSAPLVVLFALFSWLWIEKPFLAVKPYVLGQKSWRRQPRPVVLPAG
ncbi:acyltransferase [Bosea sp. SSUT16]|uniref:Acyltransferase n=1 Tax=Bosea spartocytisi TaxID=2773451 RepID=A0A927ECH7_9HYPH|nr:acyltransferase [Bosea spartocytisi]MBD3848778.1 acyltransferase [Bosea spartocytisi]MCT4471377.1 acyltransferase [Bosea spartocytisi]